MKLCLPLKRIKKDKPIHEFGYVYALRDPISFDIKYVGSTFTPEKRYYEHLNWASYYSNIHNIMKARWIYSLVSQGIAPEMIIIEKCHPDIRLKREKFWTLFFSKFFILYYGKNQKVPIEIKTYKKRNWHNPKIISNPKRKIQWLI